MGSVLDGIYRTAAFVYDKIITNTCRLLILKLFAHIASHFCPGNGNI